MVILFSFITFIEEASRIVTVENEMRALALDHHGLVASVCQDLEIAAQIDQRLSAKNSKRVVSSGPAVVAMILNGLGFTNRRLYLTHQFFENKPLELLIGASITAIDLSAALLKYMFATPLLKIHGLGMRYFLTR